jgi:hypothetical protein
VKFEAREARPKQLATGLQGLIYALRFGAAVVWIVPWERGEGEYC